MTGSTQKTKKISATITQQESDRLAQLAKKSHRTVSGYLRWLLHRHFRELEGK